MGNLYDDFVEFMAKAIEEKETKRLLRGYVQNYSGYCQFEITDGEPFYIQLTKGKVEVKKGRMLITQDDCPRITVESKVMRRILEGKLRPADAHRSKEWLYSCRDRRGGLFTTILRIGQDILLRKQLGGIPVVPPKVY